MAQIKKTIKKINKNNKKTNQIKTNPLRKQSIQDEALSQAVATDADSDKNTFEGQIHFEQL